VRIWRHDLFWRAPSGARSRMNSFLVSVFGLGEVSNATHALLQSRRVHFHAN
jgi:hypothetical protein